jgi:hypothetical protein
MGEPEGVPSEALLTPLWGQPLPFAPFPVAPWRARETPPPFRGKGMGIYPFPTPCRVWENGGRKGEGRSASFYEQPPGEGTTSLACWLVPRHPTVRRSKPLAVER